jgi:hypothetical protein
VTEVRSDTEAVVKDTLPKFAGETYMITPKLDQGQVFAAVEDGLRDQ